MLIKDSDIKKLQEFKKKLIKEIEKSTKISQERVNELLELEKNLDEGYKYYPSFIDQF